MIGMRLCPTDRAPQNAEGRPSFVYDTFAGRLAVTHRFVSHRPHPEAFIRALALGERARFIARLRREMSTEARRARGFLYNNIAFMRSPVRIGD